MELNVPPRRYKSTCSIYILSPSSLINIPFSKLIKSNVQLFILTEILRDEMLNLITNQHKVQKSKWVRSGNTTITHRRPTHGTVRKIHRTITITRNQEEKVKQPVLTLFPIKMIAKLEKAQSKLAPEIRLLISQCPAGSTIDLVRQFAFDIRMFSSLDNEHSKFECAVCIKLDSVYSNVPLTR